ncbi:MAG: universal stress protein [Desulfobacterales bacterium]|nr:universal stress protein [Desulfobacterales bacterium]MDJ0912718.1 universal stress protein [Desulfobacterales bacterium]
MEMKRILWPTDFSGSAEKALPYVTSLMNQYQTEVHVLYVIEDLGYHETWYGEFEENRIKKIHEWENKKAAERLEKICQNHLEGCPLYIRHVAIGDPAEEILKLAEKEQIDTIVMASRGRKGRFGFGSVAEKVVKNSAVPVVTIPAENKS